MKRKERFEKVVGWFTLNMPVAETELHYHDPYQLMVAVILSAQCTDKRVNLLTPPFFERFPDLTSLAAASQEEVFHLIRSCSYPNNKSRHLTGAARHILEHYNGEIPDEVDQLMTIPGIGRKTANVIASVAFNRQALAVDTHVHRVAARIGLTHRARNPLETEKQLVAHLPGNLLSVAHHWLILHGRYVCKARKPDCEACGLREFCKYFGEKNG